ncbi:hypothetical protein [Agaribacterium haliotis]|uniref:hypothetical protein n=1 Tax=Agaribacterium haliotis TaxID=2013869 RepID=UPI000BB52B78|nr:hypothetical protein [Agaribacterium haliotis]
MKTHELLNSNQTEFNTALTAMKIKELERHTAKLFERLGQPDFDAVMSVFIKALPKINAQSADRFEAVQSLLKGLVPTASNDSLEEKDVIQRLSVMLMVLVSKKYQKILKEQG